MATFGNTGSLWGQSQQQQPTSASMFSQPKPTTATGLFGAVQQQPQQTNTFGNQQIGGGLFGAKNPTPSFGGMGGTNQPLGQQTGLVQGGGLFGQQQQPTAQQTTGSALFGPSSTSGGMFGGSGMGQQQGLGFGQGMQQQQQQPQTQGGLFNNPLSTNPLQPQQSTLGFGTGTGGSILGASTTGGGLFGQTQQQQQPLGGGGLFGQTTQQPQQQQTTQLFGGLGQQTQQQSPSFGGFGATKPLFGGIQQQQQQQQQPQQQTGFGLGTTSTVFGGNTIGGTQIGGTTQMMGAFGGTSTLGGYGVKKFQPSKPRN
jgi:hypothetical protein